MNNLVKLTALFGSAIALSGCERDLSVEEAQTQMDTAFEALDDYPVINTNIESLKDFVSDKDGECGLLIIGEAGVQVTVDPDSLKYRQSPLHFFAGQVVPVECIDLHSAQEIAKQEIAEDEDFFIQRSMAVDFRTTRWGAREAFVKGNRDFDKGYIEHQISSYMKEKEDGRSSILEIKAIGMDAPAPE